MARTKRKTKIIATAGLPRGRNPTGSDQSHRDPDLLETFIAAGVDVIRFNMSQAMDPYQRTLYLESHLDWLKSNRDGTASSVTVLGDLPGPKIRLANVTPEKDAYITSHDEVLLNFGVGSVPHGRFCNLNQFFAAIGKPITCRKYTKIQRFRVSICPPY